MKKKPNGFVAVCQCGSIIGAMDHDRTERSEAAKILGEWLMDGRIIEPRFGDWMATVTTCKCETVQ